MLGSDRTEANILYVSLCKKRYISSTSTSPGPDLFIAFIIVLIAMGEAQQLPLSTDVNGVKDDQEVEKLQENYGEIKRTSSFLSLRRQYKWWLQMVIYAFFVLAGQSVGTLLGRFYFDNGGNSQWMGTLVQVVGFPVLVPFQCIGTAKHNDTGTNTTKRFPWILASINVSIGIFLAADCMLYTIGLQYLPVTTYNLIGASQLGFNAVFSYFLNRQKFTPYIVNSVVLLTISSVLLVFQTDPGDSNKTTKNKYVIGFLCTLAASAGYALMLSLTQLAFHKVIKKETLRAVIDMTIYQSAVASVIIVIGLFASGEWRTLNREMEEYKLGKVSILGLPVAPVLAVILLHDELTGLKTVAMLLAMWGFVSYMYQHYLDDLKMKEKRRSSDERVSEVAITLLWKRWEKQIYGSPCAVCWIPNPRSFSLRCSKKQSNYPANKPVYEFSPASSIHLFWHCSCMLYAVGLMYLPVSTFSLFCSSQLGFYVFVSYFLNSQKLTPLILNSIVLLTLSTVLLVLQPDSSTGAAIEGKYALVFICTLSGAAGYAFLLSVEQLACCKVLKWQTMKEILNVRFYESMVKTVSKRRKQR
ncbi:putative purine permease 10 [Sesamum angolense]|uniref:Probable purine permease n=1 Tax=Sesamum angolense TaxID=2727404 RepID=A0AAE1WTG7_9LAMI|nr:putative purine permease 10 [Sesamum angolense]